jgi:hypothetical protein
MEGKELLLHDLNNKPPTDERNQMIKLAKRGVYSDFASPLTFPVLALIEHLGKLGYQDLAKKATDGKYDHDE